MSKLTLSDILNDRTSGASSLYHHTLNLLLNDRLYQNPNEARATVRLLRKNFPEMAVFVYLQDKLKRLQHDRMIGVLEHLRREAMEDISRIVENLSTVWNTPRRIVTLSNSSVVAYALLARKNLVDSVLISSAAPKNEGTLLALKLASLGIKVELVADAALPGLIERDDYILLGADCVTEKYFVNKIGTYPLLLAARSIGARSIVLHESFKRVSSKRMPFMQSFYPPNEIISEKIPRRLTATNIYFEPIDIRFANYLVSTDDIRQNN